NEYALSSVKGSGIKHAVLAFSMVPWIDRLATPQDAENGSKIITKHLIQTIAQLQESGVTVWLVRPVPVFPFEPPKQLLKAAKRDIPASEVYLPAADYRKLDEIYAAAEKHGARILPITPDVCGRDVCPSGDAGGIYYRDSNHLSVYGALHFRGTLKPLMEAIIEERTAESQAAPSGF
ncbi:hypothetical protein LJB86_05450, partial [Deltaproteobacteria bacterium OttesenSCG-928-M10]|nr:hypothetical protein [Deltaproteobacteria bacterium OttesenSCG-928-M10]